MKKILFVLSIATMLLAGVSCKKDNPAEDNSGSEKPVSAVDLGLSVYWATFDMSGEYPDGFDPGKDYFNNVWNNSYITGAWFQYINPKDKANQKFSGRWRMPTHDEWKELIDNCNWEPIEFDSYKFLVATSKIHGHETQSIRFVKNGYRNPDNNDIQNENDGYYWSSTDAGSFGWYVARLRDGGQDFAFLNGEYLCHIRPVWDPKEK